MNAESKKPVAADAAPDDKNLALWNAVAKTNPAVTKKVNQRGGFTAIAAHSQILEATRQFGPIGIGWGYDNGEPIFADALVIIPVTIWHSSRDNRFGPLYGSAELRDAKNRLDHDAPKKAATDGLTKGLSQLGFNADVFLGRFDDNKYIEQMRQEFGNGGAGANNGKIDDAQYATLVTLAENVGADMKRFLAYLGVATLMDLGAADYDKAVAALEAKRQRELA